ncbi:hypothetical protein [Vallitalea guaymasensis]|nr:hypothetical protein [Vallitalea guaymasensis]
MIPFILGAEYQGYIYKKGWIAIPNNQNDIVLYREECFKKIN